MSSATRTRIPRSAWKVAVLGGMASYLDAAVLVTSGIAFSLSIAALRLTPSDIGLLSGLITGLLAIGALVGGRLGDKFGRRRVMALDLGFFAAGVLIITASVNAPMLYVGVVLTGLAMGIDLPVSISLVAEAAPVDQRGRMVGFSQILWGLGPIVTLILNVVLSSAGVVGIVQARILWAHILIVSIVVFVLRRRIKESSEWLAAAQEASRSDLEGVESAVGGVSPAKLKLLAPYILPLVVVGVFYTVGNFSPNTGGQFAFFILTQVGRMAPADVGLVLLSIAPIALVLGLIFMRIVDTRLRYPLMIAGGVLSIVGYLVPGIVGVTSGTYLFAFYAGLIGSGFMGEALYKVRTQEIFPPLVRSTAQGATIFVCRISAAVLAVFTPALATSNLGGLLWLLMGFNVVALAFGIWMARLPAAKPVLRSDAARAQGAEVPEAIAPA